MVLTLGTYAIVFGAGCLSILSPCVLPLVPVIMSSTLTVHRYGPLAVAFGMAVSFALIGTLFASVGVSIGVGEEHLRLVAAVLMMVVGIILLSTNLQARFAVAASGLSRIGHQMLSKCTIDGIPGQFLVGLLLGLVWSPCIGPTLGAAITLASQGRDIGQAALMMALFGLGAGLPIALLGFLSRQALLKTTRKNLQNAGARGRNILGMVLLLVGLFTLSGYDKTFQTWLLEHSPVWLITLTTSW